MAANFHFSSRILLIIFLFIPNLFQIVASFVRFVESRNFLSAMFLFSSCDDFVFIFLLTGLCQANVTQNEKCPPFRGRWINKAEKSIFETRKLVCIIPN